MRIKQRKPKKNEIKRPKSHRKCRRVIGNCWGCRLGVFEIYNIMMSEGSEACPRCNRKLKEFQENSLKWNKLVEYFCIKGWELNGRSNILCRVEVELHKSPKFAKPNKIELVLDNDLAEK